MATDDPTHSQPALAEFWLQRRRAHAERAPCPAPKSVQAWFEGLLALLFPPLADQDLTTAAAFDAQVERLEAELTALIATCASCGPSQASITSRRFFEELPRIHADLELDAVATYDGDPAARNAAEVVRSYPGFVAIAAYRIANFLHRAGVEVLPRMLTEHAHARTGIDIHPAASIGRHLCIDHGTGIVIGETAVVGEHVKLYQGVTLGGLSVRKRDARTKRHPTVGDRVVLYAGATVLGGDTVIGEGSVIGGNVWLTHSVPPYSRVVYQPQLQVDDASGAEPVLLEQDRA